MMKRMTLKAALLLGLVALLVLTAGVVLASGGKKNELPEYLGSQACLGCHTEKFNHWAPSDHANMLVEVQSTADIPNFASAPADLKAELSKAAYIVASTRFVARDPASGELKFLNVQWDTTNNKYVAYKGGSSWTTGCAGCHTVGYNTKTNTWVESGIGCEACHGPGRDHILGKGDVNKVTVSKSADVCGQCHSGADRATVGGVFMADGTKWIAGYRPGMKLTDVQGLKNLTPVDPTKLPPDPNVNHLRIWNMWEASGHGQALKSVANVSYATAECYECHSAEGVAAKESGKPLDMSKKAEFNPISCVACHDPHGKTEHHYQLKKEPDELCFECHSNHDVAPGKPAKAGSTVYESNHAALKGYGAIGIKETKSFHSDVSCIECHMTEGNHLMKVIRPDDPKLAATRGDSCTNCHAHKGDDREGRGIYLQEWQNSFTSKMNPLQADLKLIGDALKANPNALSAELKAKYDAAKTNLSLIQNDGSKGVHNFEYAIKILNQAKKDLESVKAGLK